MKEYRMMYIHQKISQKRGAGPNRGRLTLHVHFVYYITNNVSLKFYGITAINTKKKQCPNP